MEIPMKENEIVVVSKKELDEKEELITSLKAKAEKMKSDFSRYKERSQDEEKEIRRKASSELVKQLLSVADTLERAMYSGETGDGCEVVERMVEGTKSNLGMTYNQLLNTLGVIPIAPSEGERFNDELHTAIETTQKPLLPDKTILSLVRKGYILNSELIRPAEVVISRGGGEPEANDVKMEVKSKTDGSKLLRRFRLKVFKQEFEELQGQEQKFEGRLRELAESEEVLQRSVKEFDAEREEFKKKVGEWTKRKEEAEPEVNKLEQREKVLTAELKEAKKQLSVIYAKSDELNFEKDKIVVESIALGKYNENLIEEREKLLNDLEELKGGKESSDTELNEIKEKIALSIEEQARMKEKRTRSADELSSVEEDLQKAKESLNKELIEIHEIEQRKETLILEIEEAERQIDITHDDLNELNLEKDKILIESIALGKYNKELLKNKRNH